MERLAVIMAVVGFVVLTAFVGSVSLIAVQKKLRDEWHRSVQTAFRDLTRPGDPDGSGTRRPPRLSLDGIGGKGRQELIQNLASLLEPGETGADFYHTDRFRALRAHAANLALKEDRERAWDLSYKAVKEQRNVSEKAGQDRQDTAPRQQERDDSDFTVSAEQLHVNEALVKQEKIIDRSLSRQHEMFMQALHDSNYVYPLQPYSPKATFNDTPSLLRKFREEKEAQKGGVKEPRVYTSYMPRKASPALVPDRNMSDAMHAFLTKDSSKVSSTKVVVYSSQEKGKEAGDSAVGKLQVGSGGFASDLTTKFVQEQKKLVPVSEKKPPPEEQSKSAFEPAWMRLQEQKKLVPVPEKKSLPQEQSKSTFEPVWMRLQEQNKLVPVPEKKPLPQEQSKSAFEPAWVRLQEQSKTPTTLARKSLQEQTRPPTALARKVLQEPLKEESKGTPPPADITEERIIASEPNTATSKEDKNQTSDLSEDNSKKAIKEQSRLRAEFEKRDQEASDRSQEMHDSTTEGLSGEDELLQSELAKKNQEAAGKIITFLSQSASPLQVSAVGTRAQTKTPSPAADSPVKPFTKDNDPTERESPLIVRQITPLPVQQNRPSLTAPPQSRSPLSVQRPWTSPIQPALRSTPSPPQSAVPTPRYSASPAQSVQLTLRPTPSPPQFTHRPSASPAQPTKRPSTSPPQPALHLQEQSSPLNLRKESPSSQLAAEQLLALEQQALRARMLTDTLIKPTPSPPPTAPARGDTPSGILRRSQMQQRQGGMSPSRENQGLFVHFDPATRTHLIADSGISATSMSSDDFTSLHLSDLSPELSMEFSDSSAAASSSSTAHKESTEAGASATCGRYFGGKTLTPDNSGLPKTNVKAGNGRGGAGPQRGHFTHIRAAHGTMGSSSSSCVDADGVVPSLALAEHLGLSQSAACLPPLSLRQHGLRAPRAENKPTDQPFTRSPEVSIDLDNTVYHPKSPSDSCAEVLAKWGG
ncbi:hypothetical protein BaRGS_00038379, partial [Batillaria attramentaria]